ncbi:MAG: glycosyltransferase [Planctomycetota bacterium]
MSLPWLIPCLLLVAFSLIQGMLLLLQTWEHRRYVRNSMRDLERHRPQGKAMVFAPCKGVDPDLEANLSALLQQDHPEYEVVFIVEDRDDPAYPVVLRLLGEPRKCAARVVIAGRAQNSGQKVHNLRVATGYLEPDVKYLAFVDSDAQPRPEWLRMLLSRLSNPDLGASTGYRWFVGQRPSLSHWLLASINTGIMMLLGRRSYCLVWGGSWALRREVFDSLAIRQAWQGTVSDDLVVTQVLRQAGYQTRFEPAAVVASPLMASMSQAFGFMRRQYVISRVYVPAWWSFGLAATTLTLLGFAAAVAAVIASLVWGSPPLWLSGGAAVAIYGMGVLRGMLRQSLVPVYFPERARKMVAAGWFDILAGPLVTFANWLGMVSSIFGSTITWRGNRYRLLSNGKVRLLSPVAKTPQVQPQVVLHYRVERKTSAARRRMSAPLRPVEPPIPAVARHAEPPEKLPE